MDTPTSLADEPPIAERDLHRERSSLAKKAESNYAGAGWAAHQLWRRLNEELFGRQIEHCSLQFNEVPSSQFGLWRAEENAIVLDRSLLHQHGKVWRLYHEKLGSNFPPDVLLRQVAIQYISTVRGIKITEAGVPIEPLSENKWWLKEINRLSKEMELNRPTREEARWWPYSVRPEGYYNTDWADDKSSPPLTRG